jgi:hypothetical protein
MPLRGAAVDGLRGRDRVWLTGAFPTYRGEGRWFG